MSTQYDNSNSAFIGKNDRKESDKHPDIKGSGEIGGVQYWISGWKNAKGYGLRFTPKNEARKQEGKQPDQSAGADFSDDQIPFSPFAKHRHW